jgi:hypothetical protein
VGHVDLRGVIRQVARDVWRAEVVGDLSGVEGRPLKIGFAQSGEGGEAERVLWQLEFAIVYREIVSVRLSKRGTFGCD